MFRDFCSNIRMYKRGIIIILCLLGGLFLLMNIYRYSFVKEASSMHSANPSFQRLINRPRLKMKNTGAHLKQQLKNRSTGYQEAESTAASSPDKSIYRETTKEVTVQGITTVPFSTVTNPVIYEKLDLHPAFNPRISPTERKWMVDNFRIFINICGEYNLTYMLYGGSLLGSYRHHDAIPWDDDIDVWMDSSQITDIKRALNSRQPTYKGVWDNFKLRYKFFNVNNGYYDRSCCSWPWPSIDISFYKQNKTHIWDYDPGWAAKKFNFPKSVVFPLKTGPFADGVESYVPQNTKAFLSKTYNINTCSTNSYDHVKSRFSGSKSLPCNSLTEKYTMFNI